MIAFVARRLFLIPSAAIICALGMIIALDGRRRQVDTFAVSPQLKTDRESERSRAHADEVLARKIEYLLLNLPPDLRQLAEEHVKAE